MALYPYHPGSILTFENGPLARRPQSCLSIKLYCRELPHALVLFSFPLAINIHRCHSCLFSADFVRRCSNIVLIHFFVSVPMKRFSIELNFTGHTLPADTGELCTTHSGDYGSVRFNQSLFRESRGSGEAPRPVFGSAGGEV